MRTQVTAALSIVLPLISGGCASAPSSAGSTEPAEPQATHVGESESALSLGLGLTAVPNAQPKAAGLTSPNVLSPELRETAAAQGSIPVENPGSGIAYYGYGSDGPLLPAFGSATEATKTEPDKNTYLVLEGQKGPDANYDYGRHFLFAGHENGPVNEAGVSVGSITRVNLDADYAHRVTLFATAEADGTPLHPIDGSTWDPWAKRLVFTTEATATYQATLDFPPTVEDISGALGLGGYEGVQNDSDGNLWIIEDVGGVKGASLAKNAKQPNSFVYRFVPANPKDLTQGKLQALQVMSLSTGAPIVFHAGQADQDILSSDVGDLHTY